MLPITTYYNVAI